MRSLKAFVISFVLSLTVFGILAYNIVSNAFDIKFSVPTINNSTVASEEIDSPIRPNKPVEDNSEEVEENFDEITVPVGDLNLPTGKESEISLLYIGTDYQPSLFDYNKSGYDEDGFYVKKRKVMAETFLLIKIDRAKQTFLFSAIPANTIMNKNTNKTIGELYSEKGASYMVDCVYALTGIQVEYVSVAGVEDTAKILKKFGNVMYDVPCNMEYKNEEIKLDVNIQAGLQNLTPAQVHDMLRFDEYSADFIYTRESVLVDFTQVLFEKLTAPAYFSKAEEMYKSIHSMLETNFDVADFKDNIDLFFSFSKYRTVVVTYPGYEKEEFGEILFVPTTSEALGSYEEYK